MLWSLLLATPTAWALTDARTGFEIDVAAGGALSEGPVRGAVGGVVSAGLWRGKYDSAYALGRSWQLLATGRVDLPLDGTARVAPMLEVRRGTDVLVAAVAPFVGGGAVISVGGAPGPVGWTARAGVVAKYRWHRYHGGIVRLEAGADVVGGTPSFTGAVLVGISLARPFTSSKASGASGPSGPSGPSGGPR